MTLSFSKLTHFGSFFGMGLSFLAIILEAFDGFSFSHNQILIFTILFVISFTGLVVDTLNHQNSNN